MNKNLGSIVITGVLIALGSSQALAQQKISDGVVRIGVLTDMSGVYSDVGGRGSVIAAEMAVEDFIASEKPAFKVELVFADHQNKTDIGANKVREWFDTEGVDMVTDVINSSVALAVSKVAEEKNRIHINTGSATTRLTNEDCSPNTIHYVYDTYALANGSGRAITESGGDTWFLLVADYSFGYSLEADATAAIEAAGGKVLGSIRHPLRSADFSSFLLQAQASGAKVVGLANAGGDTINAIKGAREFGLTKTQSIAGLLTTIIDVHAIGQQTTQGMIFTEGFYWNLNDDTRAWSRRFFARHGKMPHMLPAGNYSAVMHYLKAVKALSSDEAGAVLARMKATPINDFFAHGGRIREDGRMTHDMYLLQVKAPEASTEQWDYYDVKAVIPGDVAFQPLAASRCPRLMN